MTKKQMWQMMLLKVRYNLKSYLSFLLIGLLFIVVFFVELFTADFEDIIHGQSIMTVAFIYIPVVLGQAIQPVEYSKCYYLVPRTQCDRKRFIHFQNNCKMIFSFVCSTLLFLVTLMIRPEIYDYTLNWYLMSGIAMTLMIGTSGYTSYYSKKKKQSYRAYIINYVITVTCALVVLYGGMFFCDQSNVSFFRYISWIAVVILFICHIYYRIQFRRIDAKFENINKEERRLFSKVSNSVV